jgi:pyruvate dehydrogenase E2 component (dihydrolipoamide acetyltransferase)
MVVEIKLPKLGQTMDEGTIVGYSVKAGDKVKKGDVIFDIETDKATVEVESPADGFVRYILAETGRTLPVGQTVMILADKDEKIPRSLLDSLKVKPARSKRKTKPAPPLPIEPVPLSEPAAEIKLGAVVPMSRLQKITAQKMLRSKREIPCFYLTVKADVTGLVELRAGMNGGSDAKISFNDFIMRALAIGLEKFPIMTGRFVDDAILLPEDIGIGLAIYLQDGLVAPVVKNVNKKSVIEIANDTKELIEKARSNKLTPVDLEGGCITVSNLGSFGVESFIPIVVPGQCSILGVGRITDTAVPDNGGIAIRKLMSLTLSVDHRIANGAYAGRFLDFVRKALQDTSNFA